MWDGTGRARSKKERMYKIGLLPLVIPVIKSVSASIKYEKVCGGALDGLVEYWKMKEKVGKLKIDVTVILRRLGNGKIHFYSVWKQKQKRHLER